MSFRTPFHRRNRSLAQEIASVAALDDETRAALYFHVAGSAGDISRDDAASALGLTRRIAAFHLDKLVNDGLLEATFKRLSGRSGPGAGRPSKLYRRSELRLDVTFPPRNYELLARLLASAVEEREGASAARHLERGARAFGASIGTVARDEAGPRASRQSAIDALIKQLSDQGFQPFVDADNAIRMQNCPYHEMARENTELVCQLNLSLMRGVAEGLGVADVLPVLEPRDGACCVAFRTGETAA